MDGIQNITYVNFSNIKYLKEIDFAGKNLTGNQWLFLGCSNLTSIKNFNAPHNGMIPELWLNGSNNLGASDCQDFIFNRMVHNAYCQKLDIVNYPMVYINTMATYTETNLSGLTNLRMINLAEIGNNGFYYYNLPSLKYLNIT